MNRYDPAFGSGVRMQRRKFIRLALSAATAWPLTAKAQQQAKPVIGYLSIQSSSARPEYIAAFRRGLESEGFVDGQNVEIEFRAAGDRTEQLPAMAADLVRKKVAVLAAAGGPPAALAAKRATSTTPVVFASGGDPVKLGLVSSFNRPGGNLTGLYYLLTELVKKRLALLRELVPQAKRIAVLVNPTNPAEGEPTARDASAFGREEGLETRIFNATTGAEIKQAFAAMTDWRPDALFVAADPSFSSATSTFVELTAKYSLPASYFTRKMVEAGGLMSYGPDVVESQRLLGVYVARILKGEKPGDLPVVQPDKYDLVINLKAAKALGIEVPFTLLARADGVIE
jgi:putative ABC transport system substrate-binding protein